MRLVALDLFRFCAALAVVLYHYTARGVDGGFQQLAQWTQFGYLGVPLFFMISGFVIANSADRRTATEFLISRVARLYPAFWIGLIFTTLVVFCLGGKVISVSQFFANATMLNDYLGIANVDGVYWTLQAEIKFYACVFLLLLIGAFNRYQVWLPIWVVATLLYLSIGQPSMMGWFISPGYSPYFISGACFYLLRSQERSLVVVVSLVVSFAMCTYQATQQLSGFVPVVTIAGQWWAAIIVILFHLLFALLATDHLSIKPRNIYLILGGITYPLYLIHNRAGKLIIDSLVNYIPEWFAVLITTLGMLLLAFVIYKYFEPSGSLGLKKLLQKILLFEKRSEMTR